MPDTEPVTALVVDDDSVVRRLVTATLERSGFTVYGSRSGDRGLDCFLQHQDEIDVVLTDVVMPVMSGPEMVEHIVRHRPSTKVLFMTGYNATHVLPDNHAKRYAVLGKPFSSSTLVKAVRDCLEGCR